MQLEQEMAITLFCVVPDLFFSLLFHFHFPVTSLEGRRINPIPFIHMTSFYCLFDAVVPQCYDLNSLFNLTSIKKREKFLEFEKNFSCFRTFHKVFLIQPVLYTFLKRMKRLFSC